MLAAKLSMQHLNMQVNKTSSGLNHHQTFLQNQFDSLDLSDNVITRIEGFPKLPRLKTLLLNNNRVTRIARNLEGKLVAAPCN